MTISRKFYEQLQLAFWNFIYARAISRYDAKVLTEELMKGYTDNPELVDDLTYYVVSRLYCSSSINYDRESCKAIVRFFIRVCEYYNYKPYWKNLLYFLANEFRSLEVDK